MVLCLHGTSWVAGHNLRVSLSNAFQASPVRISSRNDPNGASSSRTQHHHLPMYKTGGLFAQTMVTTSPEVPSPCTLPIQSGFGATSTVSTSARFMSHPWMRSPPISQLVVAPNFELSSPFYYLDHVAMLVLLQPLDPLKPQLPLGTLLPCPPPGSGNLMHGVHQGCLVDVRIAISPTGGESLGWVRVDVIVHVGKGFRKGPGLVFGLRRALACALWGGLTFALWGAMAFALCMGLAFTCALLGAFALRRAIPFALLWAFALRRAMPFALLWACALLRAMAFALLRAFALRKAIPFAMLWAFAFAVLRAFALPMAMGLCLPSVWHVVWVGALWPGTESELLRLRGLQ